MVKKKYKRMTQKEKKLRQEARDELRAKGILPPVKPRLNRKKFAKEVIDEFKYFDSFDGIVYISQAISYMIPGEKSIDIFGITPEQVGVLKMMKIACEIKKFEDEKRRIGESHYKFKEIYENVIEPILKL